MSALTHVEICAGMGGMALGLEQAGFGCVAAVEIDHDCCETLRRNRPQWKIVEGDLADFDGTPYRGSATLLSGGIPCTPFSVAGQQHGDADDRNLWPDVLRLAAEIRPQAVLIENVPGLGAPKFARFRAGIVAALAGLGYRTWWQQIQASEHGVPQLRPRFVLAGICECRADVFHWPEPAAWPAPTAGMALYPLMAVRGWPGAERWAARCDQVAPTLAGGSHKHGGPDLGPARAKRQWGGLGVCGYGVADLPPGPDGVDPLRSHARHLHPDGAPMLTVRCGARLQGFQDSWRISGGKTSAWRQVGNALPPPVARALGVSVRAALMPWR